MSVRKLVVTFGLLLLTVVAAALWLLNRNMAVEEYSSRMQLMQAAGQLDGKMDEDLQRVLTMQLLHYDSLLETEQKIRQTIMRLTGVAGGLRDSIARPGFNVMIDGYVQAITNKLRLLEKIKSDVALLRNSLQYLPGLLDEFVASNRVASGSGLLSALVEYNLFPGDENYHYLIEKLEQLKSNQAGKGGDELHNYLLIHINHNVQLKESIRTWVAAYHAVQSKTLLSQLQQVFQFENQRQSERFYYTSLLLFVLVFSLFSALGIALYSQQRARASAEQAWRQLHEALESISEAFVLFDRNDRLVLWNKKYAELYPRSNKLLAVGSAFSDLVQVRVANDEYPDDELEALQLQQLLEHHTNTESPEVESLASGRHYLVSNSRTSAGGIASVYIDITERREAEKQLRIAAAVFDTSSEGVVVTDHKNHIIAVNPSFTKITGYTADEVLGYAPSILSSGRHDKEYYQQMWHSLYERGYWEGEIWNRNKKGYEYPEWLSLSVVRGEANEVVQHIAVFSDITRRKLDEEKIRWQANYDPVTGLPNRTLFQERLAASISSSHREGWTTALLFVDLDNFKVVNDTRGHATGDWLLQEVAGRLASCIREADTVARLGGDEFTVILQDVRGVDDVAMVAQKIVDTLSEPFFAEGGDIFIGASIGITLYPNDAEDAETLIRHADLAMYRAKEAGRNGYRFFTQAMNEQMQERMQLEDALRYALQRDELFLEFQPIVDSRSGEAVRAEALVRWRHPQKGPVSPLEFVQIAEDSGLIAQLGWWVLEQACRAAADWMERGFATGVSVNVSVQQIKLGLNVEDIVSLLQELGLPAQRLTLEITESLLLEDTEKTLAWLSQLRAVGIRLSIDDFGTGYSSLSYLKRFPVNSLKIDQSFVRELSSDEEVAALTRAIIQLAETFGMDVIAEGVEDQAQLEFLRRNRCYWLQGYYFSKPLAAEAFIDYLRSGLVQVRQTV